MRRIKIRDGVIFVKNISNKNRADSKTNYLMLL